MGKVLRVVRQPQIPLGKGESLGKAGKNVITEIRPTERDRRSFAERELDVEKLSKLETSNSRSALTKIEGGSPSRRC